MLVKVGMISCSCEGGLYSFCLLRWVLLVALVKVGVIGCAC